MKQIKLKDEMNIYELLEDISCPQFTVKIEKGREITGHWIKRNFPLCWMNPTSESFKRFFKFVRK